LSSRTLETLALGKDVEATTLEKLEATKRTELSEDRKRGCVEKCGAKTLEKVELVSSDEPATLKTLDLGTDAELSSRQNAELTSDVELE
jgi:hypothetical protein